MDKEENIKFSESAKTSEDPVTYLQSETLDNTMDKEDSDESSESESSEDLEELEDVDKLIVKSSTEDLVESQEPDLNLSPVDAGEKGKEAEEVTPVEEEEDSSMRTEEDRVRDELSQQERIETLSIADEEIKKEEERREKMKILLSGYLELKTEKEIEKALLNEKRIVAQWLYPFRKAYQKEWELEMKKLKLGFQKALDYKKSHIHAIQRERKLVELNHLWADSAHYRMSEELFDFMRMRCEKLKNGYLSELEETKKYYLEREKEIVDKCTKAEERAKALALMRQNVHNMTLKKTQETLENFKYEGEFLRAKEMEVIKEKHVTYVEMIAEELQTSISPPEHKMEEIRASFEEWKTKYDDFLRVSENNRKKLAKFGDELPRLDVKVERAKKTLEEIRAENKKTKQRETEEVIRLQKVAKKYESLSPSLRKMITESEEVMIKLRERKVKLDKIVKLKKFCDKLQFESDKKCPPKVLLEPEEINEIEEADCWELVKNLCSSDVEDQKVLENLYRKLSRVKLQNQFLQHDLENLRIENMALKSDMKKYLHLIASGEWERIPDRKFQELSELHSFPEDIQISSDHPQTSSEDRFRMNLQLLNKKCRPMNQEIIKRVEKL